MTMPTLNAEQLQKLKDSKQLDDKTVDLISQRQSSYNDKQAALRANLANEFDAMKQGVSSFVSDPIGTIKEGATAAFSKPLSERILPTPELPYEKEAREPKVDAKPGGLGLEQASSTPAQPGVGALPQVKPVQYPNYYGGFAGKIDSALASQAKALGESAAVGERKGAELSAAFERIAKDDEARQLADEKAAETQRAWFDQQMTAHAQETERLAREEINPNRLWERAETGDKILAGIGMFLGAFGQQGSNRAVEVVNNAIKRDIEAQQANLDQKNKMHAAKRGILADRYNMFKDMVAAKESARASYLQREQLRIQSIASKYSGQEARAKANEMIAGLEMQKVDAQMKLAERLQTIGNAQAKANAEAVKNSLAASGDPRFMTEKQLERYVPKYGLAYDKTRKQNFVDFVTDYDQAKQGIKMLMEINERPGRSLRPETLAEANVALGMLRAALRPTIVGTGAVSESDQKIINSVVRSPTEALSLKGSVKAGLRTLEKNLDAAHDIRAKRTVMDYVPRDESLGATPRS